MKEYSTFIKEPLTLEISMYEENLEGLIKLYEKIGKIIEEKEKNKGKEAQIPKDNNENAFDEFVKVFQISNNPNINVIAPEFRNEKISLEDFFKMLLNNIIDLISHSF